MTLLVYAITRRNGGPPRGDGSYDVFVAVVGPSLASDNSQQFTHPLSRKDITLYMCTYVMVHAYCKSN